MVKRMDADSTIMKSDRSHELRKLLWLVVVAALVIGFVLYRSRSASHLDVDPHAREDIEKAKRR